MATRSLFVTQVYEASMAGEKGFDAFNAELEEAIRMLADEDQAMAATPPTPRSTTCPAAPACSGR
jgi:hypothetical protein